ncbi:MAG: MotA/TolQ/ExbB proton channel family protein [Pirellulaceae bacterium]
MAPLRHHESTLARPSATMTAALLGIFLALSSPISFAQDDILGELEKKKEQEKKAAAVDPAGGEKSTSDPANTEGKGDLPQPSEESQGADTGKASGSEEEAGEESAGEADSDEPGAVERFFDSGAIGLLLNGGIFMWPILLMGILAVGVIIERYRSLKMLNVDHFKIRDQVQNLLYEDQIEDALALCNREQGPVPAVLSAGLRKYYVLRKLNYDAARTEEQVVKAMDDYSVHIVAELERHIPVLATISSVAPMLGFLGTVQGMIVAFQKIVEQMGETNIVEAAASGIQVSLLTTCFGLIVGIPAFVAFNYFTSVINTFVLKVEQSATDLIEGVTIQLAAAGDPGQGSQK